MKFGANLKDGMIPEWKSYYLDYDILKKKLHQDVFTERDETEFVEMLDSNLEKVYAFYTATLNTIKEDMEISATTEELDEEQINKIADDIHRLEKFNRMNYTGFLKIVKKHDRHTDYILRPMFLVRLNQCPFWKENNTDHLLIKLSELYHPTREVAPIVESTEETRHTILKKFFVHANDILELKTLVLRHLPVLVYRGHNGEEIDPPISSLYLDNVDMTCYTQRVESVPQSQVIRLRWYGSAQNNRSISVEKRLLKEENAGEYVESFMIKDKYVNGYLNGEPVFLEKSIQKMKANGKSDQEIELFTQLVKGVQDYIINHKMEPVLRTYYKRTAFQIPGDTHVRMALDSDLCFIREDTNLYFPNETMKRRNKQEEWRRPDVDINFPFLHLTQESEVNRYPYATFEIKLELLPTEKEPRWIIDLEQCGLLEEAHHFSKFVHGMAIMFDTRVPLLPYWLAQIEDDRKLLPILPSQVTSVSPKQLIKRHKENEKTSLLKDKPAVPSYASTSTTNEEDSRVGVLSQRFFSTSDQPKPQQAEEAVALPPGVKIPKKIVTPIRVEPKVFFANERTYFSWMKFGTLLTTFSLALYNSGDSVGKICGIVYTLVSISILLYGVGLYYRRRELIRSRLPGPYDELVGPTVICFALMFAVGMNAYLRIFNSAK